MADPAPNQPLEPQPRTIAAKPRPEVNEPLLKWRSPEFIFFEKDRRWFVAAGVVVLLLCAGALYFHQWLMTGVILAMGAVVYQHAGRSPREFDYVISKLGVQVGERLYPFTGLKAFWITHGQDGVTLLNLQQTKRLAPLLTVLIQGADPVSVRDVLGRYLPEDERKHEDWIDRFARIIRF